MITTGHPWENTDAADLLRRQKRTNEAILRTQLRKAGEQDPDDVPSIYDLASEAEHLVADELRAAGYVVELTSYKNHVDLLVEGILRIEVKASTWKVQESKTRNPRGRYQCNIRPAQAGAADLVVVMLRNGKDSFFIIPVADLAGQHSLTVRCYSPAHYSGRWSKYYNAWELVQPALNAVRQARPEQLPLEVMRE